MVHVITYSQSLKIFRKSIFHFLTFFVRHLDSYIASIRCLYLSFGPVSHKNVIYQTEYALRGFIIINIMIFFLLWFRCIFPQQYDNTKDSLTLENFQFRHHYYMFLLYMHRLLINLTYIIHVHPSLYILRSWRHVLSLVLCH